MKLLVSGRRFSVTEMIQVELRAIEHVLWRYTAVNTRFQSVLQEQLYVTCDIPKGYKALHRSTRIWFPTCSQSSGIVQNQEVNAIKTAKQ